MIEDTIYRWQNDVPQKGWTCVDVIDLRPDTFFEDGESKYEQCEMCGYERVRFIHIMSHPEYDNELRVGCVCAEKMSDDYVGPRDRERRLRNKANRRAKWLDRAWRTSYKGNHYLNIDQSNLVVFKRRDNTWGYGINGKFSNWTYETQDQAKMALFDAFEKMK